MKELRIFKVERTDYINYEEDYAAIVAAKTHREATELAELNGATKTVAVGRSAADEPYVVLKARSG